MSEVRELVEQLAARFSSEPVTEEDGTFTVEAETPDGERVPVSVYGETVDDGPAKGTDVIMMRASAGEEIEVIEDLADPLEVLALGASTWFARLYYEPETTSLVAEAALPLAALRFEEALQAIIEVAELAVAGNDLVAGDDEDEDEDEA
jgi:hypothetical protein